MIQAIKLTHRNPSMGPYERIISYHLTNSAAHKAEFNQFLDETKINEVFDLKTYLSAYKNKDNVTTDRILKANYDGRLNTGETISVLEITLTEGLTISISDLRQTKLSGYYAAFTRYLVEHGSRSEFSETDLAPKIKEEKRPDIMKRGDEIDDTNRSI